MDGHEASLLRIRTIDRSLERFLMDIKALEVAEGGELAIVLCGDHGVWYGKYYEESVMGTAPFPPRPPHPSASFTHCLRDFCIFCTGKWPGQRWHPTHW